MSEPAFVLDSRDAGKKLSRADLDRIAEILHGRGFALLPSDTAYSVAAISLSPQSQDDINTLLDRQPMPISLAFPSVDAAQEWITPHPVARYLLTYYCPGPITVVCRAAPQGIPAQFFSRTIAARNQTIGVRVPRSAVERAVAGATPYPITTVAVREPATGAVITDFEAALALARSGTARIGDPAWCAISGGTFYGQHSTVVEAIGDSGQVRLIREGRIPFHEIEAIVQSLRQPTATKTGEIDA